MSLPLNGRASVTWYLDPSSHYPVRAGYPVVDRDLDLLDVLCRQTPAVIHGASNCQWARIVATIRNVAFWPLRSPQSLLADLAPGMPDASLDGAVARLGNHLWAVAEGNADLVDVLGWLMPGGPWQEMPTPEHVAAWLSWWVDAPDDPVVQRLALTHGGELAAHAGNNSAMVEAYHVDNAQQAITELERLTGLAGPGARNDLLPAGALNVTIRNRLRQRFRERMTKAGLPASFAPDAVAPALRADIATDVIRLCDRQSIDAPLYDALERVVGAASLEKVRAFLHVADPGDPPSEPSDVLSWYQLHYLPWKQRYWQEPDAHICERAAHINAAFSAWILDHFAAIQQSPLARMTTAWGRAADLASVAGTPSSPTLLVVADGLAPGDIRVIADQLVAETDLQVADDAVVFTRLPTVTEFTKPSIVEGQLHVDLVEEQADRTPRIDLVIERLRRARPGEVVAWTLVQPDHTYHYVKGTHDLQVQVASRLGEIASGIATIVAQTGTDMPLRVVVTSDHGRYLGTARRDLPVPPDLESHGRAAWGPAGDCPSQPYDDRGDFYLLNPYDLGLDHSLTVAVAKGAHAFRTNDGKAGSEIYPHGGLSPEEVIIPWLEMRHSVVFHPLTIVITGSGVSGREGSLRLAVTNTNDRPIELLGIRPATPEPGSPGALTIDRAGQVIPALATQQREYPIAAWPLKDSRAQVIFSVTVRLPSGVEQRQDVSADLRTDALYSQPLTLDDFGDL